MSCFRQLNKRRFQNQRESLGSKDDSEMDELQTGSKQDQLMPPMECKILFLYNCRDITNLLQLFNFQDIKAEMEKFEEVLLLNVHIKELSTEMNQHERTELSSKCANKAIVFFLVSKYYEKFQLLWKTKEMAEFNYFKPFNEVPAENDFRLYNFVANFLLQSLRTGHNGLGNFARDRNKIGGVQPHLLADRRDYNLLLLAVEADNVSVLEILLKMKLGNEIVEPQEVALTKNSQKALLTLLQADFSFPRELKEESCSADVKNFINTNKRLHAAISSRRKDEIIKILEANPARRNFFNPQNQSAARVALERHCFDMYELLVSQNILLAPNECHEEVWAGLNEKQRKNVKEIHFKYKIVSPDNHLFQLAQNSATAHDDPKGKQRTGEILDCFSVLDKIPLIQIILMIVAASRKFSIVFEFRRNAVNVADPTEGPQTRGVAYLTGQIYVASWKIYSQLTETEVFGTLAHELCHYAMFLVFGNEAKPYNLGDDKSANDFQEIVESCWTRQGMEEVIDAVFEYPPSQWHAELIVRVPHLTAMYYNNQTKLAEVRREFFELFDFYESRVIPQMHKKLPKIQSRNDPDRIIKRQKKCVKISIFISLFILTMAGLTLWITLSQIPPIYSFNKLEHDEKSEIFHGSIIYKGVELNFNDLFLNDSSAYQNLKSEHLADILDQKKPLNFSDPHLFYLDTHVRHSWANMSEKLRKKVLNTNFIFQNETIPFSKLNESVPRVFYTLKSDEIIEILNGQNLVVDAMISNESNFYMERYFKRVLKWPVEGLNLTMDDYYGFNRNESIENKVIAYFRGKLLDDDLIWNETKISVDTIKSAFVVSIYYNSEDMKNLPKLGRFFVLSDEAGAGKTVTFEQQTMEIKRKYQDYWVSYIDLKDHIKFYDSSRIKSDPKGVLKDILKLNSKSEFVRTIFEELFEDGKVLFLWNGFDEISPTFSDPVINLMKFVYENSENVQFVCTRPLYVDILAKKEFNPTIVSLKPFTKADRIEFLTKYLTLQNAKDIPKITEKVEEITDRLDYDTPLMLALIAEVHEEIVASESPNMYEIYQKFVEKKIKIWQEKNDYAKNLTNMILSGKITFDINKIYKNYALLQEFKESIRDSIKVDEIKIPKQLPLSEISRMGIFYINSETEFKFAHRTFAEFFAAKHFIDNFFALEPGQAFDEEVFDFVYYNRSIVVLHEEISKFILQFVENQSDLTIHPDIKTFLMMKHRNLLFHLNIYSNRDTPVFKIFLNFIKNDHELLLDLLHVNDNETLFTETFNILYCRHYSYRRACKDVNWTIFDEMTKLFRRFLKDDDEYSRFLNGLNQKGKILYAIAFYQKIEKNLSHPSYDWHPVDVTIDYLDNFYFMIKDNLTELEQKELLLFLLPYPSKNFDTNSTIHIPDEKLWIEAENRLTKLEMRKAIENMILAVEYYTARSWDVVDHAMFEKIKTLYPNTEIYEFFKHQMIISRLLMRKFFIQNRYAGDILDLFSQLSLEQKKEILLQDFRFLDQPIDGLANQRLMLCAERYKLKVYQFNLIFFWGLLSIKIDFDFSKLRANDVNDNLIRDLIVKSGDIWVCFKRFSGFDRTYESEKPNVIDVLEKEINEMVDEYPIFELVKLL